MDKIMIDYSCRQRIVILTIIISVIIAYIQFYLAYLSYPKRITTKIIDFPCNNISLNIDQYENRFMEAKKSLPSTGVIGYSTDCYLIDYNLGHNTYSLTTIDYDCLAKIYLAQYALVPLIIVRSSQPSIIF